MSVDDRPVSAEAQIDPVAVATARRLRLEDRWNAAENRLGVTEGKLEEAIQRGDQAAIAKQEAAVAEAKVSVAEAKVAVAEAKVAVREGELEEAIQLGDQAAIAKQEAAVAEAKAAVAEAKLAVAEAKVAVAKQEAAVAGSDEQEMARAALDRAIRGLAVAQDAYTRRQGSVPGSVGAARTHPGAEAVVGEKRAYETILTKMDAIENALRERDVRTVRLSDINPERITEAINWFELEEDYVEIAETGPDSQPFAWDMDRTEPAQEEDYMQYLRGICNFPHLLWTPITGLPTHLRVDLGPFMVCGTADVALVKGQAIRCKSLQTDRKATVLIVEVKKKIDTREVCQAKGELLAHAKLQGSKGHALVMLSDLQDDWYFFWIEAVGKKLYTLRCKRPAAVRLLGALFGDDSPDAVPPQLKQRSSIGDLEPRRPRDERTSGADAGEQDLENFDVDGSLSADDILQVKMNNCVRQLVAANPAWAPMFS